MADSVVTKPDIVAFLRARLDEREKVARAASGTRGHEAPNGERWRWEYTFSDHPQVDQPVSIDPGEEFIGDSGTVGVRSIESYPFNATPGSGPHLALIGCEEVEPGVALHIADNDPRYVLDDIAAKRKIIEAHAPSVDHFSDDAGMWDARFPFRARTYVCETCGQSDGEEWRGGFCPCDTLRLLALPFASHPDYDETWRP